MIKTILATILATAFLISVPVRAEDKAGAPAGDKAAKAEKSKKEKTDKKEGAKKEEKAGGGW